MTEYLDTDRKSLDESGMWGLASRKLNLLISLLNRVNKETYRLISLNILEEGGTGKSYSFQLPLDEYRRGRWCGNGDHKGGRPLLT